jgi:hypothetical protein
MGKPKVKTPIIGFEKRFTSLTEAIHELAEIWPETKRILDTNIGKITIAYTINRESDESLDANYKLLAAAGKDEIMRGLEGDLSLDKVEAEKGRVIFLTWLGGGFGWKPEAQGGFSIFFESYGDMKFLAIQPAREKAERLQWKRLYAPIIQWKRRIGVTLHLTKALRARAREDAEVMRRLNAAKRLKNGVPELREEIEALPSLEDVQIKGVTPNIRLVSGDPT